MCAHISIKKKLWCVYDFLLLNFFTRNACFSFSLPSFICSMLLVRALHNPQCFLFDSIISCRQTLITPRRRTRRWWRKNQLSKAFLFSHHMVLMYIDVYTFVLYVPIDTHTHTVRSSTHIIISISNSNIKIPSIASRESTKMYKVFNILLINAKKKSQFFSLIKFFSLHLYFGHRFRSEHIEIMEKFSSWKIQWLFFFLLVCNFKLISHHCHTYLWELNWKSHFHIKSICTMIYFNLFRA